MMFRPLALFIGLRYTRAKRRNHFISFISLLSMLGIALGVLALITVLSVMNGFSREIKDKLFSMVPALSVSSDAGSLANWPHLETALKTMPNVTTVAPFVESEVLLTSPGLVQPALVRGIIPAEEKNLSNLADKMVQGQLSDLQAGHFGIVLGESLAGQLGVRLGDKVTVVTSQMSLSPAGVMPRFKRFTVTGIFHAGGFGFDGMLAFVNLADAQKLLQMGTTVTGLHVNIKDVYAAPAVSQALQQALPPTLRITNWTDEYGAYFQAVSFEKTMMFCILLLIIAVAAFNLVSTLVMVVTEKEADIAILRTIGATRKTIMMIFIVQGATVGILGTLLGVLGGVLLSLNVSTVMGLFSSRAFFGGYLPSQLLFADVIKVSVCALILSLLATLYPAWRAAKMEPVEALRYE
jgi:lipoprotein-releasing system permease protein